MRKGKLVIPLNGIELSPQYKTRRVGIDLHSEGNRIESRPDFWLFSLDFFVYFLSFSRLMQSSALKQAKHNHLSDTFDGMKPLLLKHPLSIAYESIIRKGM
jgi:hypothetical protein